MPNVVLSTAFRSTVAPSLRRRYGQKFAWRAHREPLPTTVQPTVVAEDGTQTRRRRMKLGDGGSSLPLPPLMDPIVLAAKQKYKPSKPYRRRPNDQEMTEFQRALANNPFAQALATTVRKCNYTQARLPLHFLQPLVAHFRVKQGRLRGYVGSDQPVSDLTGNTADSVELGPYAGTAKSKGYIINSQHLLRMLGHKTSRKKNWRAVVTDRMREAYSSRARALSAQMGTKVKSADDWTWTGSEEEYKSILIDSAVQAFEEYLESNPGHEHLVPLSTLKAVPFDLMAHPHPSHPSALEPGTVWNGEDTRRMDPATLEVDVLMPIHDLSELHVLDKVLDGKLKGTPLGKELHTSDQPVLGIVPSPPTLRLHLALQKLSFYLGEDPAPQWIAIDKVDWDSRAMYEATWVLRSASEEALDEVEGHDADESDDLDDAQKAIDPK